MGLRAAVLLLAAGLALAAVPAVRHLREQPPPPPPATRLSFPPPGDGVDLGAGDEALDAAISPDEREVVFVATSEGTPRLWRRRMDEERAVPLAGTEGAQQPAWKGTGNVVSFFASGKLKQVSLPDGAVRDLADVPTAAGAAWLPDGSIVFASGDRGPLRRLAGDGITNATELRPGDRGHAFPVAFGRAFVYLASADDGRRTVRAVIDQQDRDLVTASGHAQMVGDLLLYVSDDTLLARRFDAGRGALAGPATPLGIKVGVSASGRALVAASPRLLLFAASASRARELAWFDAEGRRTGTSGDPADYWQVRLSPDDRFVAATARDPLLHALDVFLVPTDGGSAAERLTLALAADTDPVWSPDGRRVLFRSFQDGRASLFTRLVGESTAPDEPMLRSELDEIPTDWTFIPRSQVLYTASASGAGADVLMLDERSGEVTAVARTGFNESEARWSPDRRWVSFVSDESGQPDVYAARWPSGGRVRVSFAGGTRPRWGADGRSLFFLRGDRIMRSERLDDNAAAFGAATPVLVAPGVRDFDSAHRSNRLLVLLPVDDGPNVEVRVVVNWQGSVQ